MLHIIRSSGGILNTENTTTGILTETDNKNNTNSSSEHHIADNTASVIEFMCDNDILKLFAPVNFKYYFSQYSQIFYSKTGIEEILNDKNLESLIILFAMFLQRNIYFIFSLEEIELFYNLFIKKIKRDSINYNIYNTDYSADVNRLVDVIDLREIIDKINGVNSNEKKCLIWAICNEIPKSDE